MLFRSPLLKGLMSAPHVLGTEARGRQEIHPHPTVHNPPSARRQGRILQQAHYEMLLLAQAGDLSVQLLQQGRRSVPGLR